MKRTYKVRKGNLRRIADLSPQMVARLRADGATVTYLCSMDDQQVTP